jgi:hypothetical protein
MLFSEVHPSAASSLFFPEEKADLVDFTTAKIFLKGNLQLKIRHLQFLTKL